MLEADFEIERQQADEELARLLGALVVEPIDHQLEERIRGELFSFGEELDSKLKKQLASLGKSRDLERHFEELGKSLEGLERKLQQQGVALDKRLGSFEQEQTGRIESMQSLIRQLDEAQLAGNRQLQSDIVQRLQQQDEALRNHQLSSEQKQVVRAEALQAALSQQALIQGHKVQEGLQNLLTQLSEKLDAAQSGLVSVGQQATRSLLAELQRQAVDQQEQLQRAHADLAGMLGKLQTLPAALTDLQGQAIGDLQQMQGLVKQQQVMLDSQQLEILQLHRTLRGFAWTGLTLGVLSCAGLALLALHTPAIRALLGLAG